MPQRDPSGDGSTELHRLRLKLEQLTRENTELRARACFDEELSSDAARYEAIVANLAAGVVLQSADGQILACNGAAERILGMTAEQMAGRSSLDSRWRAIHEDGAAFPGETHPAMVSLRTGRSVDGAIMGVHKPDGSLTWISINAQPLFATGHAQPHAVVTSFVDITTLKRSEERACDSEEKLRFALQAARMGTWDWDIENDDVRWSDNVAALVGLEPGSFTRTYAAYMVLVHSEDRVTLEAAVERAMVGHDGDDFIHEHRIESHDGKTRWMGCFGRVVRNHRGEPVRMAGTIVDISGRKALEDQLQLSQRMQTVGRLAGGVAHDFNNLLMAILGCAELVGSRAGLDPEVHEALETICEASEKGAGLTRQLLSFARKQVLDFRVLDLRALIADTQRLLSRIIGASIRIRTQLGPSTVLIRSDQAQIEQVLVNLAVNARDAMPDGGELEIGLRTVTIPATTADWLPPGHYALLEVSDHGKGVDPTVLPHIFDPFFTTKSDGTGLGLATCYGIVKQLGGDILVDSEPGRGARFSIYLPLTDADEDPAETDLQPGPTVGRGRILLAEDDAVVRSLAERGLRALGYEVLAAADGYAALDLLGREGGSIDLLVSDVVMPNMNGYALAERLRVQQPGLGVLFVSGYADGVVDSEDARRGIADAVHLAKPYTIAQLAGVIAQLLDP